MVNSNQDGIIRDVINSVAQVYNWKNFYNPVKKQILHVSYDVLQHYIGDYSLNETKISVFKKNNNLYLSLNGGSPMQLFFTSNTDFFLSEIQANVSFEKSKTGNSYNIILKEGDHDVRFLRK